MLQLLKAAVKPLVPGPVIRKHRRDRLRCLARASGLDLLVRDLYFDLVKGEQVLRVRSSHEFLSPTHD